MRTEVKAKINLDRDMSRLTVSSRVKNEPNMECLSSVMEQQRETEVQKLMSENSVCRYPACVYLNYLCPD